MIFSDMLEIAIGLAFIFMMLSLALTSLNEMVEIAVKARGRLLFEGIGQMLAPAGAPPPATADGAAADGAAAAAPSIEQGIVDAIYTHPLLRGLMRSDLATAVRERKLPSYIPARNFAQALLDQALAGAFGKAEDFKLPALAPAVERLRFAAEGISNEQLRRALTGAADVAKGDIERARLHLERRYESATDRISGHYKRRTQRFTFAMGLLLAVVLNINTLTVANRLATDSTARRAIVEQSAHADPGAADPVNRIQRLGLPIGWEPGAEAALLAPTRCGGTCAADSPWLPWLGGWVQVVAGFALTALAVTLGAPFWFDVLNKLMVVRATVKPAEKSKEEGSEDRPASKVTPPVVTVIETAAPGAAPPVDRGTDAAAINAGQAAPATLFEGDAGEAIERSGVAHREMAS